MTKIVNLYNRIEEKYLWPLILCLFVPFVYSFNTPSGSIKILDDFFDFARPAVMVIIVFVFFIIKKKKPSKLVLAIFIMEMWQLLVTLLTNHKWVVAAYDLSACIAVPLLIELYSDKPKTMLSVFMLCFEVSLYPNLFTLIFKTQIDGRGIGWYLLGAHNILATMLLPAAAVAVVYFRYAKNKFRPALLLAVAIISCFICECSTAEVAMAAAILVFIVGYLLKDKFEIPLWLLFAVAVFGCFFVIFAFADTDIPFLKDFITKVLNRDVTFTGRTYIWSYGVAMVKESPIIGHGFRTWVNISPEVLVGHAHNYLLDKAVVGGIPMLLMVFVTHFELIRGAFKQKNSIYKIALLGLLFGIFLTYITESYFRFYRFLIVFALMYNLDTILGNKKEEN